MQTDFYKKYLQSPAWRRKREKAIKRAGRRCEMCGVSILDKPLEVHHKTYERLGRELPNDLKVVCKICHGIEDWSRALRSWAEKVYGADWYEQYDYGDMAEKFDSWLESRNNDELE